MNAPRTGLGLLAGCLLLVGAWAQDALLRATQDVENRYRRQFAQIDTRQEQERIRLNSRLREERAKIQRAAQATVVNALAAGGDPRQMAQIQFEEAELANRHEHDWELALTDRFESERATLERRKALELARLAAQHLESGEETGSLRALAEKSAEVTDRWQEQIDALRFEESAALGAARLAGRTRENLAAKAMAAWLAQQMVKARETGQLFNALADPAYLELTAKRDGARNETETEQETLRAKFDERRRELERQRDEELGALTG